MQNASQFEPSPKNPSSPIGYRPLASVSLTQGMGASAYSCIAAAAAGMGLLVGVAVALTTSQARVSAAPRVPDTLNTRTSGLSMLPASSIGSTASLLSRVEQNPKPAAAPSPLMKVSDKVSHKHSHRKHGLRKLLGWKKTDKAKKRMDYVSPNKPTTATAEVNEPTALQLATAAAAQGPFYLGMQGDVTVANYDANTGVIQTYEGETYLLAKNTAENGNIQWQDYPFNVHYRCDEIGNCTLSHAGSSAIAKLTR